MKECSLKTRKKCPSPNQLLRLFRINKPEKKKTEIVDHITNCYHCAHEFEFILRALRYEKTLNLVAEKFVQTKKMKIRSFRLSWKTVSAIAGISLVCLLTTIFFVLNTPKNANHRTPTLRQIAITLPQAKKIHKSSLNFRWENVQDSEYYTLELYDETLYQIWSSNKIFGNNFKLSEETASRLEVNRTYFWMISAFFPNGRRIESQLKKIILINN